MFTTLSVYHKTFKLAIYPGQPSFLEKQREMGYNDRGSFGIIIIIAEDKKCRVFISF